MSAAARARRRRHATRASTLPPLAHSISRVYSWLQRLRSLRHRFWFGVSEHLRWSRGAFRETPSLAPPQATAEQAARMAVLCARYQVRFERRLSSTTAMNNYEYLDILDRAWSASGLSRPCGGRLSDVGCASFWYAAALHAFFAPQSLMGIDVEGHRLFKDGHTRIDYAQGYLADFPDARFVIGDYGDLDLPAEVITAWFPFVTPAAILAWRLPLSLLAPQALFRRVARNLIPGGVFVMVNHGATEAGIAQGWCNAAGLRRIFSFAEPGVFSGHRHTPAILSIWERF